MEKRDFARSGSDADSYASVSTVMASPTRARNPLLVPDLLGVELKFLDCDALGRTAILLRTRLRRFLTLATQTPDSVARLPLLHEGGSVLIKGIV